MEPLVEEYVRMFLRTVFYLDPHQAKVVLECMTSAARVGGYDLDDRFADAGLGAGPEARVAAAIVARSLVGVGGGDPVDDAEMHETISRWLRTSGGASARARGKRG
jgi:hypothetical protein